LDAQAAIDKAAVAINARRRVAPKLIFRFSSSSGSTTTLTAPTPQQYLLPGVTVI
jgi:hypothetical protein